MRKDAFFFCIGTFLAMVFSYVASNIRGYAFCILLSVITIVVTISLINCARYHENMWAFIITALAMIPINWHLALWVVESYIDFDNPVIQFLNIPVVFLCFLSIEELIVGIVVRLVFPNQKEVNHNSNNALMALKEYYSEELEYVEDVWVVTNSPNFITPGYKVPGRVPGKD